MTNRSFQRLALASLFAVLVLTMGGSLSAQDEKRVVREAFAQARQTMAKAECTNLVISIGAYYDDYSKLPEVKGDEPIPTDPALMNILLGLNAAKNPKNVRYIQPRDAKGKTLEKARMGVFFKDKNAWLRDPWGNPYYVLFDRDYDEEIANPFDTQGIPIRGRMVVVLSAGPDGKIDLDNPAAIVNRDNVYSWK